MSTSTKTMLIVWHSRTGAARQMAQAALQGAEAIRDELGASGQLDIALQRAADTTAADLLAADGYLFCAPENLAALSGEMKEFFDRNYYAVLGELNGRPYALLISAGTDGQQALKQAERIAQGWRLNRAMPSRIINTAAQTREAILAPKKISHADAEHCQESGATLAGLLLL